MEYISPLEWLCYEYHNQAPEKGSTNASSHFTLPMILWSRQRDPALQVSKPEIPCDWDLPGLVWLVNDSKHSSTGFQSLILPPSSDNCDVQSHRVQQFCVLPGNFFSGLQGSWDSELHWVSVKSVETARVSLSWKQPLWSGILGICPAGLVRFSHASWSTYINFPVPA